MMFSSEEKQNLKNIVDDVLFDEPMKSHTWIAVGGSTPALVRPKDASELKSVLEWCRSRNMNWYYIGRGSNLLISDKGVNGLVISLERGFSKFGIEYERDGNIYAYAEGGVSTTAFISYLSEEGLSGLEFLAGVPGTIGGNIMTNAGSKKESVGDIVEEITVIDRHGKEITLRKPSIRFSYRRLHLPRSVAIKKVIFKLTKDNSETIRERVESNLSKRKETQPQGVRTFGSTFKNPNKRYAGKLIEEAGLKGVRVGGARVSTKHANFIVNENNAKAKDVLVLMNLIRQRVKERYGVLLEPEVHVIGEKG